MPLLHRPSFERAINEGLHLQDDKFGANLLLVCANGARYSDDPRVLCDTEHKQNNEGQEDDKSGEEKESDNGSANRGRQHLSHSSGWTWFDQVQKAKKSFLTPSNLYDLQFYAVSLSYFPT
jgi:hypothetical protein